MSHTTMGGAWTSRAAMVSDRACKQAHQAWSKFRTTMGAQLCIRWHVPAPKSFKIINTEPQLYRFSNIPLLGSTVLRDGACAKEGLGTPQKQLLGVINDASLMPHGCAKIAHRISVENAHLAQLQVPLFAILVPVQSREEFLCSRVGREAG